MLNEERENSFQPKYTTSSLSWTIFSMIILIFIFRFRFRFRFRFIFIFLFILMHSNKYCTIHLTLKVTTISKSQHQAQVSGVHTYIHHPPILPHITFTTYIFTIIKYHVKWILYKRGTVHIWCIVFVLSTVEYSARATTWFLSNKAFFRLFRSLPLFPFSDF